jgi:hypothetical protein
MFHAFCDEQCDNMNSTQTILVDELLGKRHFLGRRLGWNDSITVLKNVTYINKSLYGMETHPKPQDVVAYSNGGRVTEFSTII